MKVRSLLDFILHTK